MTPSDSRRSWAAGRPELPSAQDGGVLVEFALVALVLYLMVAAGFALGRAASMSQTAQDVARLAARELALYPLAAGASFEAALVDGVVRSRIYDRDHLVIDLDEVAESGLTLDEWFAGLPIVNRALRPAMIFEAVVIDGAPRRLLRAPGALLRNPASGALTVAVPLVIGRDADGVETVRWVDVVEELRDAAGQGPFAVRADAIDSGLVAVRVNLAFQAAALSGFRSVNGPFEPNGASVNLADDAGVAAIDVPPGELLDPVPSSGDGYSTYGGRYGLGRQAAFGRDVRPFRRVVTGQALFRRELFTPP